MPLTSPLALPLDYSAIERILPHRYPFLLVDRIIELEPDKRIVGIKNVSLNERYLSHQPGESPSLPPTILTEAVAQVGAILILSKPENREKLQAVLTYHVVPGKVMAAEVLKLSDAATVNGQSVRISVSDDDSVKVNEATVLKTDIQCSNGVIHVIDAVLLPE